MHMLTSEPIHYPAAASHDRHSETQSPHAIVDPASENGDLTETADRDAQICLSIEQGLLAGAYPMQSVAVVCSQGGVCLSGTVNSWHHKQMAQEGARDIQGVHKIINQIEVVPDALA